MFFSTSFAKVFEMLSRVEREADSAMFFSSTLLLKVVDKLIEMPVPATAS